MADNDQDDDDKTGPIILDLLQSLLNNKRWYY